MKKPQIIIPMSGMGKRFIDAGYIDPKPLIVVDKLPIIEHVVNLFGRPDDVIFICNQNHVDETDVLQILKRISPNCKIFIVPNENRKGPVDAVYKIFDSIDDDRDVIVSYCDYGTVWNYDQFLDDIRIKNSDGAIACYKGFHPHMLGGDNYAFCKEKNMFLEQIKEKESFSKNKMDEYASNGTYYFKSGKLLKKYFKLLIDLDININGEYYVSLVYNLLINDGLKVSIFEIQKMLQWGTPYDLEIYKSWSNFFKKEKMEKIKTPNNTTLILPMAGNGSRFSKEGYSTPKPFIDVENIPMVIKAVDDLPICKDNIFIVRKEHIDNFDVNSIIKKYHSKYSIVEIDGVTEGQACTCELGMGDINIEDPILISACDNGIYYNVEKCEEMLFDESIDVLVWSFRNNQTSKINPNSYAWLDVDSDDNIRHVSCKNFIYDNPLITHAIVGTMFFRKAKYFLDGLKINKEKNIRTNNEFYVDDVLNRNIEMGLTVKVFEVEDYICWGTPDDYKTYNYWSEYFNKK